MHAPSPDEARYKVRVNGALYYADDYVVLSGGSIKLERYWCYSKGGWQEDAMVIAGSYRIEER